MTEIVAENPYLYRGVSEWEQYEGQRLRNMDQLLASVAESDLGPVIDEMSARSTGEGVALLDIGAGTGIAVEELCTARGAVYYALDANPTFLNSRSTPTEQKILARSESLPMIENGRFDVTCSRAATAWNAEPQQAIREQLRITSGIAVFTEYDWSNAVVRSEDSSVAAAGMAAKSAIMGALTRAGFKTGYGAILGSEIDAVAQAQGIAYERREIRHQLPEDDYREVFLGAAQTIVQQLRQAAESSPAAAAGAVTMATFLEGYSKRIEKASSFRLRLPSLITQVVRLG